MPTNGTSGGLGPGTLIDTTESRVPVEWLTTTHEVLTRDGGVQPVLEVCRFPKDIGEAISIVGDNQMACGTPDYRLVLARGQRLFVEGADIALHFGLEGALCEGHSLFAEDRLVGAEAQIFHQVRLPAQEVIRANGCWVESGRPLGAVDDRYPCLAEWESQLLARLRGFSHQAQMPRVA